MSSRQDQSRPPAGPGAATPAPGAAAGTGERQVFRAAGPQLVWWVWVAFAALNLIDLAVQGRDHFAAEVAAFILLVTGVVYACAWRPRILAGDDGVTLLNPLRDYHVPWGAISEIKLGHSLEIHCQKAGAEAGGDAAAGGPAKARVLYSWAIQSSRRGRSNADRRARRADRDLARQSASYARLPPEAREMKGKTAAELIARQLGTRVEERHAQGVAGGQVASWWAWWSMAAMVAPAALLLIVTLG